ncbi:hypothetical protein ACIHAR_09480 [Streptomyces sp. NPDC052016]|uniref:hypothetical protein n=1 Tax=Streptomyces sp. NPDC052016 TaxID=3365680 RepID=UPI0037D383F6
MAETIYRVTWKDVDTGPDVDHVRDFRDIDQGYDYYQMMQRACGRLQGEVGSRRLVITGGGFGHARSTAV